MQAPMCKHANLHKEVS